MKNVLRNAVLVMLVGLLSGCSTLNGNRAIPLAPLASYKPSLNVRTQWSVNVGDTSGQYLKLTPAVKGSIIYASDAPGYIYAIDGQHGRRIWRVNTHTRLVSGVGADAKRLYVGTDDGYLLALDRQDGHFLWRAAMSNEVLATPAASKGIVLAKSEDGKLAALDAKSGRRLWGYDAQAPSLILRGSSSPVIVGNRVVVGFANGEVAVLRLQTGKVIWKQQVSVSHSGSVMERMVDIDANPTVSGGVVYVATYQGRIGAYSLQDGQLYWQHGISSYSGLVVGPKDLYVTDASGNVWAFDRASGAVNWKQRALFRRQLSGPALIQGAVVVGDVQGYLHWMSQADGHFIARNRVGTYAIIATPFVMGHQLVALSSGGHLDAFYPHTG